MGGRVHISRDASCAARLSPNLLFHATKRHFRPLRLSTLIPLSLYLLSGSLNSTKRTPNERASERASQTDSPLLNSSRRFTTVAHANSGEVKKAMLRMREKKLFFRPLPLAQQSSDQNEDSGVGPIEEGPHSFNRRKKVEGNLRDRIGRWSKSLFLHSRSVPPLPPPKALASVTPALYSIASASVSHFEPRINFHSTSWD